MATLSQRVHEPKASELWVATKAALSSGAATVTDGLVYQLLLFVLPLHYGVVAAAGAVAGAVVNFLINRHYTFAQSAERAWPQALRYALVSLATFLTLRALLAGGVEGLGWSPRVAWLPAKLLAFAVVSYPAQRLLGLLAQGPGMTARTTLASSVSAHVRRLWPRYPWWPPAPFVFLAVFWGLQGKLRWDHFAIIALVSVLAYGSSWTKRLFLGILPIGLVGVLYDTMRFVKNVGLTRDNVHVCDVRAIDQRFFGMTWNGTRVTLHDYLQQHWTPFLDRYCAIPYGIFIAVVVAYSVYLFRKDYPGLLRFTWSFLALNVAGFITYHVYPAAPPWYYHHYGCVVDLATHASEGPNLARVDAWLGIPYFAGVYGRSSDVFGAVPSLHVAYPLLMLLEGFRRHRWVGRVLLIWFYLSMCFAAVYLDHHWVFDIVLGSLYTVVISWLMRRLLNARLGLELPQVSVHGVVK